MAESWMCRLHNAHVYPTVHPVSVLHSELNDNVVERVLHPVRQEEIGVELQAV